MWYKLPIFSQHQLSAPYIFTDLYEEKDHCCMWQVMLLINEMSSEFTGGTAEQNCSRVMMIEFMGDKHWKLHTQTMIGTW